MPRTVVPLLGLLLAALVYNVWGIGIVHNDDAMWHLYGVRSEWSVIWDWAQGQGRVWPLLVGPLMLHAARWQGTLWGDLLQFAPFVVFFVLWHVVIALYFGRRAAIISGVLFCSLFALRFEGSMLISYALVAWPAAIACALAIIAGRRFVETGRRRWCVAAAIFLLLSLFTNEALTVTFLALFALSWFGNVLCRANADRAPLLKSLRRQDWSLATAGACVATAYAALALLFALKFPSSYPGHVLAPFDAGRIFDTLATFSLNGSTLYGMFHPYSVDYVDRVLQSRTTVDYPILDGLRNLGSAPLAVLCGLAAAFIVWRCRTQPDVDDAVERRKLPVGLLLIPGLALLILPIAPVALTDRYQNWHLELGVNAYLSTIVCHFGTAMIVACILIALTDLARRFEPLHAAAILVVAIGVGLAAMLSANLDTRIARDMRPEGARWAVFDRAVRLLAKSGFESRAFIVPQFRNGSWFTNLPATYWQDLAQSKYGKNLGVIFIEPTIPDLAAGATELSYFPSEDGRTFDVLLARIAETAEKTFIVDRVVIEPGRRSASDKFPLVLSYLDAAGQVHQVRVTSLPRVDGRQRAHRLDGIRAMPGTVQLVRQTMPGKFRVACGDKITSGMTIVFGGAEGPQERPFCVGNRYLGAGWGTPEVSGVWTGGATAEITLPLPTPSEWPTELEFYMASFTSLGYHPGIQTVYVSVNGRPEQVWEFASQGPTAGTTSRRLTLPTESGPEIKIRLRVEFPMNPKSLGISTDSRDLGVHLRTLSFH